MRLLFFTSFSFLSLLPGPLFYYIPTLSKVVGRGGGGGYLSKGKTKFLDIKVKCCQVVQPTFVQDYVNKQFHSELKVVL